MADEIEVDIQTLKNLGIGEFYIKVGSKKAFKIVTSNQFIGDKDAISEEMWKAHLKYQKKHYYKSIDSPVDVALPSNDVSKTVNTNTSVPIPSFNES